MDRAWRQDRMVEETHDSRGSGRKWEMSNQTIMPTVSICVSTYNREAYLGQTLESIRAQTYQNYEIVIVDDGSTDGTEEMICQLPYKVSYAWQENAGCAAALNRLIQLAKGQYIAFIDSDDVLMPDAIERMVRVLEGKSEDVFVYGPYLRMAENGLVYGKSKRRLYSGYVTRYLFKTIFASLCGSMFPKKILQEAGGFDESLPVAEDYDLLLRLSLKYRFIALPEPTFKRRRHTANQSSPSFKSCLTELNVLERFYYEKGGHKKVPMEVALGRFFKCAYRAGKAAVREGSYKAASSLLVRSFRLLCKTYFAGAILGDFQGYKRTGGYFQDVL